MSDIKYDELTLKELLIILFKNKNTIILFVLVGIVVASLYQFVLTKPNYESKAEIILNIPESVSTEYGGYKYPTNAHSDFLSMILIDEIMKDVINKFELSHDVNELRKKYTISQDAMFNAVFITYTGTDEVQNAEILNYTIDKYKNYVMNTLKKDAIDRILINSKLALKTENDKFMVNEKLLKEAQIRLDATPKKIVLQKMLMSNPELAAIYAEEKNIDLAKIAGEKITEEIINPNYLALESVVNEYMENVTNSMVISEKLKSDIEEITLVKEKVHSTAMLEKPTENVLSALELTISQISSGSTEGKKVSPSALLIFALSVVVSALLGIMYILIKLLFKFN